MTDYTSLAENLTQVPISPVEDDTWLGLYVVYKTLEDLQPGIGRSYIDRYQNVSTVDPGTLLYFMGGTISNPLTASVLPALNTAAQTTANSIQAAGGNYGPALISGLKTAIKNTSFFDSYTKSILNYLITALGKQVSVLDQSQFYSAIQFADSGSTSQNYDSSIDVAGNLTFSSSIPAINLANTSEITIDGNGNPINGGNQNLSLQAGYLILANANITNIGQLSDAGNIKIDPSNLSVASLSGSGEIFVGEGSEFSAAQAGAFTGTIAFAGGDAILNLGSSSAFHGTISGLQVGNTLDLSSISATSATITAADVLLITEAGGATFSLKLDPSESYSDLTLYVQDESSGGSNIIAQSAPAVSGSQSITVYSTIETALGTMATYDATVSVTPTTVDFGAERADGTLPEIVPITVTYTGGKPDPTLPDDITVSDGYATINGLGPDKKSGTLSIENPGFVDGNNTQALPLTISYESGSVTLDLASDFKIYTPAVPEYIINGNTGGSNIAYYDFGVLHVGDTGSLDIVITNVATGALVDSLVSSPSTLGEFTAENGVDLSSGQTGTIAVTFTADVSGLVIDDQSTLLNLVSHDSAMPDEATSENPSLSAEVYNYAQPELVEGTIGTLDANGNETINYPAAETGGTLTQTGADSYTLDFGTVFKASAPSDDANILIDNALPSEATGALDDGLSGSFSVSGSGINHAVSSVIAAGTGGIFQVLGQFSPSLTSLGTNTLTVIYHPTSVDSAGTTDLPDITLTVTDDLVACFLAGTRISTARGEIAVEQLAIGDQAVTQAGVARRVTWLGHRRIDCGKHPKPADVWPVRICPGAFGLGLPHRDLFLSPDHAVFAEGVLIPIKYLINRTTIAQEPRDTVTYWHIELERHDVILAEGLPCESYLETGNRDAFANGGSTVQLHPDFGGWTQGEAVWEAVACAPLRIEGPAVRRVATRLERQARELGLANKNRTQRPSAMRRIKRTSDLAALLQPDWYLARNPDVAAAGVDATMHYINNGCQEGRLPCSEKDMIRALGLVDSGHIIFTMPDVITARVDPVEHFCATGWRERRRPNPYFETGWYLDSYDVPPDMNPLVHYVLFGERLGYRPSKYFDPAWYAGHYALGGSMSALAHYLKHRRKQRVSPLPSFDVAAYRQANVATMRRDSDPYAHFLAVGQFATADEGQAVSMAA